LFSRVGCRICICNSLFAKNCSPCSLPCTGPKTVLVCPCPSPKGWYRTDQESDSVCIYSSLSEFFMVSLSRRGCRDAGGAVCMECVSESAWLAWCVHVSWHGSAGLCSEFCCRSSVACWGSCPCFVPCSSQRTKRAGTCPSPKGWYCACRVRGSGCCHKIFVEPSCCYSGSLVAWAKRSDRVGGLCLPWM
jgi:hypothetical protein